MDDATAEAAPPIAEPKPEAVAPVAEVKPTRKRGGSKKKEEALLSPETVHSAAPARRDGRWRTSIGGAADA